VQAQLYVVDHQGVEHLATNYQCLPSDSTHSYLVAGFPADSVAELYAHAASSASRLRFAAHAPALAILDMNSRNNEQEHGAENSLNLYSACYMAEVAGMSFDTTSSLTQAMQSPMILLSSRIKGSASLSDDECDTLRHWVEAGGVLIAPAVETSRTPQLSLFGLTGRVSMRSPIAIHWKAETYPELRYIDQPEEKVTAIGSSSLQLTTTSYTTMPEAEVLATFDDSTAAVVKYPYGRGCTYTVGLRWRDVIARAQLNKDGEAQRVYSNGFEPSADMYPFLLRSIYTMRSPVSVWKYTVPAGYRSVLVPTHDCDSRTAYEEMHYMADYEHSLGLCGHYFLTVHYYRDAGYLSAFYDSTSIAAARQLLTAGHTVGSHSLSHFPDFSTTERFPMDTVTAEEYAARARHDVESNVTTGGSTWAEVVLSKQILEGDLGNQVRSFRSGHLCVNNLMPQAYVEGAYENASTYSACDVLSEFPFFCRLNNTWSGDEIPTLQVPLHISDVLRNEDKVSDDHWDHVPDLWEPVVQKEMGNYAATVLLIHPNREYKMEMQRMLIDRLDTTQIGLYNFEDYADFWRARHALNFDYQYDAAAAKVVIRADRAALKAHRDLGFFVETGAPVHSVTLTDENGTPIPIRLRSMGATGFVVLRDAPLETK
jgi:hypothetical protein